MQTELKILLLEDVVADSELELWELKRAGIECKPMRVDNRDDFIEQLHAFEPDVILSDFSLPQFDGLSALTIARQERPQTPFIFVSGTIGEDTAIEAVRRGATDYILKTNMARLGTAVKRAVKEAAERVARTDAEDALVKSNERFQLVSLATNDAVRDWDLVAGTLWWSDAFQKLFGYPQEHAKLGVDSWFSHIHPDDQDRVVSAIQTILDSDQQSWSAEYRFICEDGSDSYVLDRGYEIRDAGGKAIRMIGAMMDITGRKLAEEALRLTERAIEASVNPIIITTDPNAGARIVYVNPAFERVTGYTREEVTDRNCNFLQRDDRNQADLEKLREALHEGRDCHAVLRNYRKDGSLFWNDLYITPVRDAQQKVTHFVGVQYDITDMRRYREELEHQANHDALTGLANRNLLADRLKQALLYGQRHARLVMVAFVDLDHFKFINDSLGHGTGDRLLIVIAERLQACVRKGDTVARPGGDEFVLILSDQTLDEGHHRTMERIMAAVSDPCMIDGHELRVTCSIGLSVYPDDATDAETLLRMADAAMYRAKDTGRNSFQFHTKELTARIGDRLTLEAGLRRALDRGELFLNYQPQYDLATGQANGMEALVRWAHPERGLIPPGAFIPLAEENGLIVQIGEWVAMTACAHNKAMQDAGLAPIKVAINLSARQFRHKGLVKSIDRIIGESGLDARYVELELTESMVMHSPDDAARTLAEFKEMGVQLSLDDFGTGYSSLAYLKKFPVHRLKVDQSFVRDIGADLDDTAIVQSIIALGHALNLKVCAEGVETPAQLDFLKTYRCDEAQGYLFSRPVTGDAVRELLMQSQSLAKAPLS